MVLTRYRYSTCILETKTKVGSTTAKAPAPRTNPNINETPTTPKSHTHPSHEWMGERTIQRRRPTHRHPIRHEKSKTSSGRPPTMTSRHEEDDTLKEVVLSRYRRVRCILETKTEVGRTTVRFPSVRTNPNIDETPTTVPKSPRFVVYYESIKREVKYFVGL